MIFKVSAGKNANEFDPASVYASVGDVIVFEFYPAQHSVAQSVYGYPCILFSDVQETGSQVSFFSGIFTLDKIPLEPPTWNLTVNSTEPILFYCSAPESCTKYGMVGVINPNSSQTLDHQHALALDAGYTVQPGQDVPNEEEGGTTTLLSAATVSSTNVGSSRPTPTSSQPPVRVLVSVLCAVLVVVALIATTVIICFKWRSRRHTSGDAQAAQPTARDGSAPDTTTISDRATQSENYHSPFSPSDQGVVDHASELEGSSSPASSTSSPYSVHGIHEVMNTSAHGS